MQAGGSGNLVGITLDESGKGEIRVERPLLSNSLASWSPSGRLGRRRFLILVVAGSTWAAPLPISAALPAIVPGRSCFQHGLDLCQMVFLDPVEHKAIRREQVQAAVVPLGHAAVESRYSTEVPIIRVPDIFRHAFHNSWSTGSPPGTFEAELLSLVTRRWLIHHLSTGATSIAGCVVLDKFIS